MIRQALRKKRLSDVSVETVENVQGNYNSDNSDFIQPLTEKKVQLKRLVYCR